MSDIFNTGLSSLLAFKNALTVTSNNIANVATPYYSREEVQLVADTFKNGVNVASVNRDYDEFLSKIMVNANATLGMTNSQYQELSNIETMLQANGDNVTSYINDTLQAIRELNTNTNSSQYRIQLLNKLQAVTNKFNSLDQDLANEESNISASIATTVSTINNYAKQLASINQSLSSLNGADPSSLLDQQEQILQTLAANIDFGVQKNAQGQITLTLSNGINLVNLNSAITLSTGLDPLDNNSVLVLADTATTPLDITHAIHNGNLAGLYASLATIEQTRSSLDKIALQIADAFNTNNLQGVDAYGNLGVNILNDINSTSAINSRSITNINNTGNEQITISITSTAALTASNYSLQFDTNSHYILTREVDQKVVSSGAISSLPQAISVDGFTATIANTTIVAGDQFTLVPTQNGSASLQLQFTDPNLVTLAWPINITTNNANTGNGSAIIDSISNINNSSFSINGQLNPPLTIKFISSTQYQIINSQTNTVIEGPIVYSASTGSSVFPSPGNYDPGYRITITGNNNAGDSFNINYNANALNNQNGLQLENTLNIQNFNQPYQIIANQVSVEVNQANISYQSSTILQQQSSARYAQLSGVSIEEEIQNIVLYQSAYEASAKILEVAKEVFNSLLQLSRG